MNIELKLTNIELEEHRDKCNKWFLGLYNYIRNNSSKKIDENLKTTAENIARKIENTQKDSDSVFIGSKPIDLSSLLPYFLSINLIEMIDQYRKENPFPALV